MSTPHLFGRNYVQPWEVGQEAVFTSHCPSGLPAQYEMEGVWLPVHSIITVFHFQKKKKKSKTLETLKDYRFFWFLLHLSHVIVPLHQNGVLLRPLRKLRTIYSTSSMSPNLFIQVPDLESSGTKLHSSTSKVLTAQGLKALPADEDVSSLWSKSLCTGQMDSHERKSSLVLENLPIYLWERKN